MHIKAYCYGRLDLCTNCDNNIVIHHITHRTEIASIKQKEIGNRSGALILYRGDITQFTEPVYDKKTHQKHGFHINSTYVSITVSISDSNIVPTLLALQITPVVPNYKDRRHVMVKTTYV